MKSLLIALALCCSAWGQQFSHIIFIVQENRTPDNLFAGCTIPGADVVKPGASEPLYFGYQPSHTHADYLAQAAGNWTKSQKRYVRATDIQPYCTLATQYGFANRMFQTNQGSSMPAHLFIFTATSAPSAPGEQYSNYFVAENNGGGSGTNVGGCNQTGLTKNYAPLIDPSGNESVSVLSCFDHATLTDLMDAAGLSWKYYAVNSGILWNTPQAIAHICGAVGKNCEGQDWLRSEVLNPPQVLTDIADGQLANVSWVTPAASYSDHPADGGGGPSWVASIVNAIGQSAYWQNTAIVVTWDDWGGWYDHVPPLPNTTGWCPVYCYGFRVPLLVISPFTPPIADNQPHDFGSMVRFVETNFNLPLVGDGTYADAYADNLGDFFTLNTPRQFVVVPAKYKKSYFLNLKDRGKPDTD